MARIYVSVYALYKWIGSETKATMQQGVRVYVCGLASINGSIM